MMKKNNIPSDYRFQPTDEELINHYLLKIVTKQPPACSFAVNYCDLYGGDNKEPWKFFDGKSSSDESDEDDEENELYFYTRLKKKTKNSTMRTERTVGCGGTWQGQTKGTAIYGKDHLGRERLIGMRKMFSYKNKGAMNLKEAKRWRYVMHQYSLEGCYKQQQQQGNEWVLCRIKRIERKSSNSQHFEAAALDTPTSVDESTHDDAAPAIDNEASPRTDGLGNFDALAGIVNGATPPQAINVDELMDELPDIDPIEIYIQLSTQSDSDDLMISWN